MAQDMNVVTLVGRLTRDSEIRYTQSNMPITRFSIAVNRDKRSNNGQRDSEVSYFDVVMFGKYGEVLQKYLVRGTQVAVNGELRQNRYEVEGQARSRIEIIANNLQLLGSSNNAGNNSTSNFEQRQQPVQKQSRPSSQPVANSFDMDDIGPEAFDDDIPF